MADTENRRILVFSAGDIDLSENDILNSATLAPTAFAPGTLVTIRAAGAANNSEVAEASGDEPLPTKLAGVEVYLNGAPLPLLSVSPDEIQAQLPYDLGSGTSGSLYLRSLPLLGFERGCGTVCSGFTGDLCGRQNRTAQWLAPACHRTTGRRWRSREGCADHHGASCRSGRTGDRMGQRLGFIGDEAAFPCTPW